jgi:hypothetical protein
MKTVFKVECEFNMGFYELYETEELAYNDIENVDWKCETGMALSEILDEGLLSVTEIKVKGEE